MNPAELRLYIAPRAPNPRRVQMFIAEKGITGIPEVAVDLNAQEHRSDAFRARSPLAKVPALELPAGKAVELKPGGYHVMLMDLKKPLAAGETVPISLVIETAGKRETVEVKAPVRPMATSSPPAMQHKH